MTKPLLVSSQCALVALLLVALGCTDSKTKSRAVSTGRSTRALFQNGGFESGDLTNWTVNTYINNGINYPPASVSDLQLQSGGIDRTHAAGGPTLTQIPNGLTPASSLRYPAYGSWSAVVNERGNNHNVNLLTQTHQTSAADVDPADGKIHVRFTIAPVLENPGHLTTQQPYFYVVVTNVTQNTILFSTFNYSNQPSVPWKTDSGGVVYTDWQIVDVAPGSTGLVIGDSVKVEVYSAGCSLGGHYGEVYVDAFGAFLPGLSVAGHGPQSANDGSNITYSYLITNNGAGVANNVTLKSVLPDNTTFVSVTPPAGITCTTPSVGGTGTVTCNVGSLNPSAGTTVLITVNINSGTTGTINHGNYTIGGDGQLTLIGPLIQTNVTSGVTYADLSLSMSDGVAAVGWGQPVHYTIQINNLGPNGVTDAPVTDTIPAQLTGATWTCTPSVGASCGAASGTGNISTTVSLPSGASASFSLNASVVSGSGTGTLSNTASVSTPAGTTDPDTTNNSNTVVNNIGTLDALTLNKDAIAPGTVVSSPAAINCGPGCSSATANFLDGSMVSLNATASAGAVFIGWSGACSGASSPCSVTMAGATSVTASFGYAITSSVSGGNGTIVCTSPVAAGASSTCTITPNAGYALATLTDNGTDVLSSVSGGTYVISNVQSAHAVSGTFKKALGISCSVGSDCASSFCVDGICCNNACTGQCQACDVSTSLGTCTAVSGAPHGSRTACASDSSACRGTCNGVTTASCTYPGASTQCRGPSCTNGVATIATSCAGTGSCPAVQTQTCAPYICGPTACKTNCIGDNDCSIGNYCNGSSCAPKLTNASVCSRNSQCQSNHCADGLCCNSACAGRCEACDVSGSLGSCTPVTGSPHGGRAACASDGTSCAGVCNGVLRTSCFYPGSTTQCRSASCANGTSTLAAYCSGTGSCPGVQHQNCIPYMCGAIACMGTCASDGDCASGSFCSGGVCLAKLANSAICAGADQCQSGNCVDGVCCNSLCAGQCQACNVSGSIGTCIAVTGVPRGGRPPCATDGSSCQGTCNGTLTTACTYPGSTQQCRAPSCIDGAATLQAFCDGTGKCAPLQQQSCSPYVCGASACAGNCTRDTDCSLAQYCSAAICVPKLPNGSSCAGSDQCTSGQCVDGYCCNAACAGECQACDVLGGLGTCTLVHGAPHGARAACTSDGTSCAGVCDGSSPTSCGYPNTATQCRGPSCSNGVAVLSSTCDGAGHCPAMQSQTCFPIVCGPLACKGSCSADGDCTSGRYCSGGLCVPTRVNGSTCGGANQCQSGQCVDGVCCNTACVGQCQACDVTGSVGTCTLVNGQPHGSRTPCLSDGTSCGGSCDGTSPASCSYPSAATQCRAPTCQNGVEAHAASCTGSGSCPPLDTRQCGNYVCGTDACRPSCNDDSDCTPDSYCRSGECRPRGNVGDWVARGSGCSAAGGLDGFALALFAVLFAFGSAWRRAAPIGAIEAASSVSSSIKRRGGRIGAAVLLFIVLAANRAGAQDVNLTFQLNRYQPSAGAYDILAVESARVPEHLALSTSLSLNYARQPLRLISTSSPETTMVLVQSQTTFDLGLSLGVWEWAEISAVLPLTSFQRPRDAQIVSPVLTDAIPSTGLGDLRLTPKARLFHSGGVQLALAAPITLPVGRTNAYLGNQSVTGGVRALADFTTSGDLRFSGNLGVLFGNTRQFVDLHVGNSLQYAVAMELPLPAETKQWAVLTTLVGEKVLDYHGVGELPLELLGAVRWESLSGIGVTLGGGPGLTNGYGTPRYRVLTSISWTPREAYGNRSPAAPMPPVQPMPVVAAPPPPPPPEPAPPPAVATIEPPSPPPAMATVENQRVRIDDRKLVVLEPVLFETNKDILLPQSFALVRQIGSTLKDNPGIERVRIQGHTDSRGNPVHNLDLSRRRAERIRKLLIQEGLPAESLQAEGFGSTRPLDSNDTKEGRTRNRRVEFEIIWR